jgi:TM2 domain-containing membrane protein YozV
MDKPTTGGGSGGNIVAALASLIVPGLGQLAQGRIVSALLVLVFAGVLWILTFGLLGWLGHIFAALDAAFWKGPR